MDILHICMLLSVLNHMKLLADISLKAIVSATAEIILTVTDWDIQRSFNDAVGLNLLDLQ